MKNAVFYGALFDIFDIDSNGHLSFVEYLMALSVTRHNDKEKKLKLVYKIFDINKDNKVEIQELTTMLKNFFYLNEKLKFANDSDIEAFALDFFSYLDTNNDNFISEEEFIIGCKRNKIFMDCLNTMTL